MQKIRGIKVEPDSAADDAASNDAVKQSDSGRNESSHQEESEIMPQSDANQRHVANETVLKKHNKKMIVRGDTVGEGSIAVNPGVDASAKQQGSKGPVISVNLGKDVGRTTVTETSNSTSSSSDKQTSSESLRTCAHCRKRESTLHEFKKCKK